MNGKDRGKRRRGYRPGVEALEAVRLLSTLLDAPVGLAAEWDVPAVAPGAGASWFSGHAWDEALVQTDVAGLLVAPSDHATDPADVAAGLSQVDRYLTRTWARAGLSTHQFEDCTQAVYASLLDGMGRDRFDRLFGEVGQTGIRDVLSRETADGPEFFRVIDMIKKRAQRERSFLPIEAAADVEVDSSHRVGSNTDLRATLHEAIAGSLSPREAALIRATLQGETPSEIAEQWGVAPKTVSNEKTRALQKLREVLTVDSAP